jgi:transposase
MAGGDLTDAEWELVGALLPPGRGRPGRPGHANRPILDGILWRAREGARWRAVPERCGEWDSVWRRFARWRDLGVFEAVFAAPPWPGAVRPRSACRCSTAPRSALTSTRPAPRGAGRPGPRAPARRVLDHRAPRARSVCAAAGAGRRPRAAPAPRRPRPAARLRPHAGRGARDPRLRGLGRGPRRRLALRARRHGLRRGPGPAGAAAARRRPGDPAEPGPQGACMHRSTASRTGCGTGSSGR